MALATAGDCGPPVGEGKYYESSAPVGPVAGATPANGAPEPTSLTFNGRGIDLNEDAKVDTLSPAAPDGAPEPTSLTFNGRGIDLDERPIIEEILGSAEEPEASSPGGGQIRMVEVDVEADGFITVPFVQEPNEKPATGSSSVLAGDEYPIVEEVLGRLGDFR